MPCIFKDEIEQVIDALPVIQDLIRIIELTEKYMDRPIDFADASLLAIAERIAARGFHDHRLPAIL